MKKTIKTIMAFLTAMTMTMGAMSVTAYAEEAMAVTAGANSEKLLDENSGLYYTKADDNGDGVYDHAVISPEFYNPWADYVEYPYELAYIPKVDDRNKENSYHFNTNYEGLTSIVIPDEIDGLPVTEIAEGAFARCKNLEDVVFPNGITEIPDSVFYGSRKIKSVTIPNGVTAIGATAFYDCVSLEDIKIPESVRVIKDGAFASCISLKNVTLPESVTTIEEAAFQLCDGLTDITIENPECDIDDTYRTICANGRDDMKNSVFYYGTIHGYTGSTAEAYAEKFGYKFDAIDVSDGELLQGDADVNNEVGLSDVITVAKYNLNNELYPLANETAFANADMNSDGKVNGVDTSALIEKQLGKK